MNYGKTQWFIPDGYMADTASGAYVSHEAVCVLNMTDQEVRLDITVYFEDEAPLTGLTACCPPQRTNHVRLDQIHTPDGKCIPRNKPYAVHVQSSCPVIIQYSRMDVSQPSMALMTNIPYGV